MQTVIVLLVVAIAAVYLGRRFYRSARSKSACGCDGCASAGSCGTIADGSPPEGCADIPSRTAGEFADERAERDNRS